MTILAIKPNWWLSRVNLEMQCDFDKNEVKNGFHIQNFVGLA